MKMKTTKILGIHDKETIQKMLDHIVSECSAVDVEKRYNEMLDECSESCGMCKRYGASRIIKEMSPTDYRCGLVDYTDSLCRNGRDSLIEIGSDYYQGRDVDEAKEQFIDGLRDELSALEDEREELENGEDEDGAQTKQHELDALTDKIIRKQTAIEACEDYAF